MFTLVGWIRGLTQMVCGFTNRHYKGMVVVIFWECRFSCVQRSRGVCTVGSRASTRAYTVSFRRGVHIFSIKSGTFKGPMAPDSTYLEGGVMLGL